MFPPVFKSSGSASGDVDLEDFLESPRNGIRGQPLQRYEPIEDTRVPDEDVEFSEGLDRSVDGTEIIL
jgi:hypothetical protein